MPFVKDDPNINRNGRPPGTKNFTTKVREALAKIADGKEYTYEEALIKSVLKKAIVDGDSTMQRIIWNYLDGLPAQRVDVTSDGKPIPILAHVFSNNSDKENTIDDKEDPGGAGGDIGEQDDQHTAVPDTPGTDGQNADFD